MRILLKTIGAVVISAVALTGCTSDSTEEAPNKNVSVEQSDGLNADSAAQFVAAYYTGWFEPFDVNLYTDLETEIMKIVGSEDALAETDPMEMFATMPEEDQKKLAEKTIELNKNSDYYDFSGMTYSDQAILNIMIISLSSIFGTEESVEVSANPEMITVDGDTAIVPSTALTVKYGDTENAQTDDSAGFDLILTEVDGEWKVDGQEFLDMIVDESEPETEEDNTDTNENDAELNDPTE